MKLLFTRITDRVNLSTSDIKPFIGSKNYEESRDFYVAMGWVLNFDTGDISEMQLGTQRFYLQNYYQRNWCQNSMLHISVEDAQSWYTHAVNTLASKKHGAAKVRPPTEQDYGALVTFVWDPAGVLLHFAQHLQQGNA
jgi:catechol 2,3-dioxygenase-like lactoylglutathione lyase family enzyme